MLIREEGRNVHVPWDSTEGLLQRYALTMTNVLLCLTDHSRPKLRSHSQRARDLRHELAGRLDPNTLACGLAQAERYAHVEAQERRGLLARASRYHGCPIEPHEIVAGLTATVTRTEAGLMRGLAHQMADARMQFRAATWHGDLATALQAEAAWNRLAGQMSDLLVGTARQMPDQVGDWLKGFRAKIDAVAEYEAPEYRAQYDLSSWPCCSRRSRCARRSGGAR